MHIVDGALSNPGVIGGAVPTLAGNTPAIALPAVAVRYLCRSTSPGRSAFSKAATALFEMSADLFAPLFFVHGRRSDGG
jgi:hypothetical protein